MPEINLPAEYQEFKRRLRRNFLFVDPLYDLEWVKELINEESFKKIINDGLATYYLKSNGSELIYWINEKKGIIVMRFIQN